MIGMKYTPELLADLAKTPHLRRLDALVTPDEQDCKTTLFDVGDVELASTSVDCDTDGARFGSVLGCDIEKVTVSVIEETHTDVDKITSFFEDATSDEPWLVIIEPD